MKISNMSGKIRSLRLSAILILLFLLSCFLLSNLMAKYTDKAAGSDSGRVAAFSVSAAGSPESLSINGGGSSPVGTYVITLKNDSETAVSYKVVLTLEESLPEGVSVTLDEKEPDASNDGKVLTFSGIENFLGASYTKDAKLNFTVDGNVFSASGTDKKYSIDNSFNISVSFAQID